MRPLRRHDCASIYLETVVSAVTPADLPSNSVADVQTEISAAVDDHSSFGRWRRGLGIIVSYPGQSIRVSNRK